MRVHASVKRNNKNKKKIAKIYVKRKTNKKKNKVKKNGEWHTPKYLHTYIDSKAKYMYVCIYAYWYAR